MWHPQRGLGLPSVYSIVKRHGGFIDVQSDVGVGTTFEITLPATEESEVIEDKKEVTNTIKESKKILVMDDEVAITTLLYKILTKFNYQPIIASDGEEALKLYKEFLDKGEVIDLVILDLTVPNGMGGKETMLELKKINKDIKVIISSGYSNESISKFMNGVGFANYIAKPYKVDELIDIINKTINN